jgi:Anti-sigma factor NepR
MVDKKTPGPPIPIAGMADDLPELAKKRNVNVKDHIGRQLRALYDEVASQPVPDRFMELLNRLGEQSGDE